MKYKITQSRLLYVLSINDRKHQNLLKVGEVFVDNEVADSQSKQEFAKAVRAELDKRSYMKGVTYNIEYVECTTYAGSTKCYKADDVYRTLRSQGIYSKLLDRYKDPITGKTEDADIWFAASVNDVQCAIKQIKDGHGAGYGAIKFRPEQDAAIKATVAHFKKPKGKAFLWNAKMRFGKTLSGLQVAKEMGYESTLIITHRPVVDKGWHDDFKKIFGDMPQYSYATRMSDDDATGGDFYSLTRKVDAGERKLIFFVSMQYLRLSRFVGGKERNEDPLKKAIMQYDWDFVMVDEAHEGIEAAAGVRVMDKLKKENTRILSLSGTPFNLLDKYEEGEIYTWDYVMEQRAKHEWDDKHFGDPNPYAELPQMKILTFTLPKMIRDEAIENNEVFKFHEFFRVWTEVDKTSLQRRIDNETSALKRVELQAKLAEIRVDKFVHEGAVRRFLDKLVEDSDTSMYPFSTDEFRDHFKHTFWLLPGVKEAAALKELLDEHDIFGTDNGMFHIINAAGDGNIEDKDGSALADVEDNIRGNAKKNITKKEYTITLSCGKLTTGVSVPEWTAVLCMKGSENTPAANYMQTIFRVQTHAVLEGRQKTECYVFDFAPDRALTAVAETAKMAVDAKGAGKKQMKRKQKEEEEHLEAFIKLCPVLSMDEGEMGKPFSANRIFEKLSNVYIERAVRSGYADNSLYNPDQLMNLTPEQEKALGDVHDLLGSMPASWKPEKITVNDQGLGDDKEAEMVKFIYYLTSSNVTPSRPSMSAETDDNGRPMTDDDNWSDVMCAPSQMFPYLFISKSRLVEGIWTDFSMPSLYKEWTDPKKDTDEAKKKRDEENREKRARMSVLRGVSIRIPLLVYGAEINDDAGEEITIDNFADEKIVDQASWEEFMPKGFTKETFNILKECFDRSIFTGAAKRIRQMVKEADTLNTEDRINKIATIFSYFHNPDKETVLTPWRVVNMHLSDTLGGWCFLNEEFDGNYTVENQFGENVNAARFVDRGEVTRDVFSDYNARILEINSKTGLYPLYMAYSIFKSVKEPEWRKIHLTGERGKSKDAEQYYRQAGDDLEIWKDVLQDNIFVVCRTKMAVSITKRTLAGFRKDVRMNARCYEHEVSVNDLVKAGIVKDNVTKKGNDYLYKGKKLVKVDDLIADRVLQEHETTLVGKKHFYNGKEVVSVNDLVKEHKLTLSLTLSNGTYYYNGKDNLKCDMINVLRAKPEYFQNDVVKGRDFWHVYNSIPTKENEDINNMKFSAIVGNPPYQVMDGGAKASASPIYQLFVDAAKQLSPSAISVIMPSKWFAGGKGLDDFRESTRVDKHMEYMYDYVNAKDLFPTASIGGGICYFLWRNDYNGKCKFTNVLAGHSSTKERYLDQFDVIVRYNEAINIIDSAVPEGSETIANIMLSRNPFGPSSNVRGDEIPSAGQVELMTSQGIYYVNPAIITDNKDYVDAWKVTISKVTCEHAGEPDKNGQLKVLSSLRTLGPNCACTDSYLIIGKFKKQSEAENLRSYLATKFARFMLLMAVSSINLSKDKFQFVPLQDFSRPWTDADLYAKYDLTPDEIAYIERLIKPIES
ncbi:MAG: Eco57I restriction-modification methylase domain-containing protein [Prevotella sp.]|nr:Eco57I restriction-modification methylase domain-containing protein [Prevotella sp.]